MTAAKSALEPAQLLVDHIDLFLEKTLPGPVLDLACGEGRNGVYLAQRGFRVVCCDISLKNLREAKNLAQRNGASIEVWQVDLEKEDGENSEYSADLKIDGELKWELNCYDMSLFY